jgi:hypothetical protein
LRCDASHALRIAFKKAGQIDLRNTRLQEPERACEIFIATARNSPAPPAAVKPRRRRDWIRLSLPAWWRDGLADPPHRAALNAYAAIR